MITSTITSRGQTTLPRQVRDALQLEAGRRLIYEIDGDAVTIRQHPGVMASFGALATKSGEIGVAREAAREEWADHVAQEGLVE